MGNALQEQGELEEAIEAYNQALALKPDYAEAYNNMGNALKKQGKSIEAIEAYKKALALKPNYAEAYNNMGTVLQEQGELEEAIDAYKKALALKPDYAEAYYNMGNTLQEQGKLEEAMEALNKALSLKPNYAEAYNNMGTALQEQGELEEAIEAYKKALALKPDFAKAYYNMGTVLQEQGKLEEAIEVYKKALSLKPDYAEAYNNMGIALQEQGKLEEAIEVYKKALSLKPDYAEAYNNMGNALKDQGKLEEAIEAYKDALSLKPDYAEAYSNMGLALQDQGKLEEAIGAYNKALSLKPDYAEAYYNSSFVYNLRGEFQKGLKLYEWRLNKKSLNAKPPRDELSWDKTKSVEGKKFVVYEEQGLGDIIQFCRYLILLEQKGADVTFKVTPALHAILQTIDGNFRLSADLPEENTMDFEAPLMSLPYLLNTSLETIPVIHPYLFADPDNIAIWGKRLSKGSFKVGICWQGRKSKIDIGRSFPLSLFESISKLSNVELISLHKGEGENQITSIDFDITTLGHDFDAGKDAFLDTAAVMMNCDLIITSDTAIAHLAGALGCPTWVALQHIPDWRWMLDCSISPWYPSMTLYRQKQRGDWAGVFDTIKQDLIVLLDKKGK